MLRAGGPGEQHSHCGELVYLRGPRERGPVALAPVMEPLPVAFERAGRNLVGPREPALIAPLGKLPEVAPAAVAKARPLSSVSDRAVSASYSSCSTWTKVPIGLFVLSDLFVTRAQVRELYQPEVSKSPRDADGDVSAAISPFRHSVTVRALLGHAVRPH